MVKKRLFILLCLVMSLSLIACGKENETMNPTSDVTFDRAETTDDNSNSDESFFNNENAAIRINSKNSAEIEIVISDEKVADFYELSKNDQYSDAQFYIQFYTIENEGWNTYASVQVYPNYASFSSAEQINEEYDANNELISSEPLWGYSTDSQGMLTITENELIVTFIGSDVAKKLDVNGLYYHMEYWADSFVVLGEGPVAQILSDGNVLLADNPVEFTVNRRGEFECRVYQEGIDNILADGIQIRLYKDSDEYVGDYGYMYISASLNNPETGSYICHMGYREPQGDGSYEEKVFEKKNGTGNDSYSEMIDFPIVIRDGYMAIKCNDKAANDMFAKENYYGVFSVENKVIPGGLIVDAMKESGSVNELSGKYQLVADYTKPSDGEFFRPITEYYRVYSIDYPVAIVGDWGWYLWTDQFGAPGPVELGPYEAYGPLTPRETTCTLTYIESMDEFGELVQYVARVSFPEEDDVLLAWATDTPYFPYAYNGVNEMSLEGFPSDFVHKDMMNALATQGMDEALQYYEQGNVYFDLLECLREENSGSPWENDLANNYRNGFPFACTCGLGRLIFMEDSDLLDELDVSKAINTSISYYMEVELENGDLYATTDIDAVVTGYTSESYRK